MASRGPAGPAHGGRQRATRDILALSIASLIRDKVNDRLTSALNVANPSPQPIEAGQSDDPSLGDGVITSEEEIAGFRIVQAIAAATSTPAAS